MAWNRRSLPVKTHTHWHTHIVGEFKGIFQVKYSGMLFIITENKLDLTQQFVNKEMWWQKFI